MLYGISDTCVVSLQCGFSCAFSDEFSLTDICIVSLQYSLSYMFFSDGYLEQMISDINGTSLFSHKHGQYSFHMS